MTNKCKAGISCYHQPECDDFLCPGRPVSGRKQDEQGDSKEDEQGDKDPTFIVVAAPLIGFVCTLLALIAWSHK